jgi:hypothetical protein
MEVLFRPHETSMNSGWGKCVSVRTVQVNSSSLQFELNMFRWRCTVLLIVFNKNVLMRVFTCKRSDKCVLLKNFIRISLVENVPVNVLRWTCSCDCVKLKCSGDCVPLKMLCAMFSDENVPVTVFSSNYSGDFIQGNFSRLCFSCECVLVKCSIDWLIEHFRVNTYFEVTVLMSACLRRCFQVN